MIVCAWFALAVRQAHDTNRASEIISGASALSGRAAAQASSLLRAAGTLNPDSEVDLLRTELALLEHRRSRALRIVEGVVRREPMNVEAWLLFARAGYPNRALLKRAIRNIALLDPKG